MEEQTLARRLNKGSRTALEQAIRQFTPYVSTVVFHVLEGRACREDVEEIVADVFLTLWSHAQELTAEKGLRPWLGTVARNKAKDWLRTHRDTSALPDGEWAGAGDSPEELVERREWAARLWKAVDALPEPDRTLFFRYYYQGGKLKEIARDLGLSQTAAKQRLFRGRKTLKTQLTEGADIL